MKMRFDGTAVYKHVLLLCLLIFTGTAIAQQSSTSKSGIGGLFSQQKDEFLKPDEAFQVSAVATAADKIEVQFVIAKGYYLYRKRMGFSTDSTQVKLGEAQLPDGQIKHDEYFGDMEVYHNAVIAALPVARAADGEIKLKLKVKYQGCAEAGLCYNPLDKEFDIDLPASSSAGVADTSSSSPAPSSPSTGTKVSEQDALAAKIRDGNLALVLGTFFLIGLLLSFTPCVLPMVPILSGIIVGAGDKITPMRGFSLSLAYVLGSSIPYTIIAVLFALAGKGTPQTFFQNPWVLSVFALILVTFASSMFGAFEFQMPSAIQSRLTSASNNQKGGTLAGSAIMGFLSSFIVSACVTPALAAVFIAIAISGSVTRGALALFVLSFGMGTPLIAIGTSAGALLPKVGAWMNAIKGAFGYIMLGVALWILKSILPDSLSSLLWGILMFVAAYSLFALEPVGKADGVTSARKGIALVIMIIGTLKLVAGFAAINSGTQFVSNTTISSGSPASTSQHESALPFKRIKSVADLDREVAAAASANKPVMLDINAEWCTSCKEMEKYTFPDAQVVAALSNAVLLQADVTDNDADDKAILNRFQIFGPPTIAFFVNGQEKANERVVGYVKAEEFAAHIKEAFAN